MRLSDGSESPNSDESRDESWSAALNDNPVISKREGRGKGEGGEEMGKPTTTAPAGLLHMDIEIPKKVSFEA